LPPTSKLYTASKLSRVDFSFSHSEPFTRSWTANRKN